MIQINKKYFVWLFVGFSALIYGGLLLIFSSAEKTILFHLKLIPYVVTADVIFLALFTKYIWRWKVLYDWLIPFPNLNGTWKGNIHSTWVDPLTNKRPDPIPVILTIKQSFLSISCVMRTEEMESYSFIGGFVINRENQVLRLVYSYDSIPKQTVKDRSPQHFGTILFNIQTNDKRCLSGEYWTGRKTTGTIDLEFWKKELLDRYPKDLGEHPVTKQRSNL
ncbi:MAG: hypothetical protein WA004_02735 [Saprospiraceae bacterium]